MTVDTQEFAAIKDQVGTLEAKMSALFEALAEVISVAGYGVPEQLKPPPRDRRGMHVVRGGDAS